ncbi:FKBP-type peptidyl-prolyl cis-trans isomerase [Litoribrevibacter albus]|uniref:Peptidyl-prolyl cis-trans isomerase n=1 Tax=Litoribrevibacter albus TaxID=1473156 RepID=A0AA37W904_9GAMM|nr:FKBP-type peptidyl-prolyl cis-trans isomerase [Litoribrevibacter albus]GLQ32111.1 peptidyl-prolyl cis-trans isomerase [Litoribrevibacter albus]
MFKKNKIAAVLGSAALVSTVILSGCGEKEVELKTNSDKVSYGIGYNVGSGMRQEGLEEMNVAAIAMGLQDALADKERRLSMEELTAAFNEVRAIQDDKMKALNDENLRLGQEFLKKNGEREGVTVLESGLQYEVLKSGEEGAAQPEVSDMVTTHYHGTLVDGTVFDSSVDRGQPATFPVGGVIKGWIEALQMMKVGDKWKLYVPANLAYGTQSPSPKIPANSALIFEVELLSIKGKES